MDELFHVRRYVLMQGNYGSYSEWNNLEHFPVVCFISQQYSWIFKYIFTVQIHMYN